jgi:hypothetical protein
MKRQRCINCTPWVRQPEKFFSARSTHFGLGQLLLTWLFASLLASLAYAVPMTTTYQGYLENADGEPLNDTVDMTFALYDTAQGGDALWSEIHQQVEVTNGVFSLILGNTTQFDDNSLAGDRYLGVTVGNDPEMTPRQPITSAFFVMRAEVANSVKAATVTTEAIVEGAVTADKIAAQTITGDKIANLSGHSVTELDDVTNAGSGKIITDAERQKLAGLSGGTGGSSTFSNITVQEQLNVKKQIKVGENSLILSGAPGIENHIWATPDSFGKKKVYIQSIPQSGDTIINSSSGNVGIGTENPNCKLHVKGTLCSESIQTSGEVYGKIWYSKKYVWDQHDNYSSKKMIHSSKGVCFLTYIRGKFEGGGEYLSVNIESDGYWYLKGHSHQSAVRAEARCIGSPN